jgi:hypothetical protein
MKKIKLKSEEFIIPVINYMLREFNADYESVKKKPIIKKMAWFEYYWDTPESKQEWRDWTKDFIKNNVNYKPYKIDKIINEIDLMYGLKVYDNGVKK